MISPGATLRRTADWDGTTVTSGNALEVKLHHTHTNTHLYPPLSTVNPFFVNPPLSSSHSTYSHRNWLRHSSSGQAVLSVWKTAAWPLIQNLWREKICSRSSSLAGFPAEQSRGLLRAVQSHLWWYSTGLLLGSNCCSLHVRAAVVFSSSVHEVKFTLTCNCNGMFKLLVFNPWVGVSREIAWNSNGETSGQHFIMFSYVWANLK